MCNQMTEFTPEQLKRMQERSRANIARMNAEFDAQVLSVNPEVKRVGDVTGMHQKTDFIFRDIPWTTTPDSVLKGRKPRGFTKRGEGYKDKGKPKSRYMHFDGEVYDGICAVFKADADLSMKPDDKKLHRTKRKEIRRLMDSIFNLSAFGVGTNTEQPDGTFLCEVKVADLRDIGAIPDEYKDKLTDELLDSWSDISITA